MLCQHYVLAEQVYALAKYLIVRQMVLQGRVDLALRYLKKTIFDNSRSFKTQAKLLEKVAKLTYKSSGGLKTK